MSKADIIDAINHILNIIGDNDDLMQSVASELNIPEDDLLELLEFEVINIAYDE